MRGKFRMKKNNREKIRLSNIKKNKAFILTKPKAIARFFKLHTKHANLSPNF